VTGIGGKKGRRRQEIGWGSKDEDGRERAIRVEVVRGRGGGGVWKEEGGGGVGYEGRGVCAWRMISEGRGWGRCGLLGLPRIKPRRCTWSSSKRHES